MYSGFARHIRSMIRGKETKGAINKFKTTFNATKKVLFYSLRCQGNWQEHLIRKRIRPGLPTLFIKIKSTAQVTPTQLSSLSKITKDFGECEAICFSQGPRRKQVDNITVYPWAEGIQRFFAE